MAKLIARHIKTVFIIIVLVLVSVFAAFWLRSILEKSPTPKIVMLDTVKWSMTKPQELGTLINENVESHFEEDSEEASVDFTVMLGKYIGNDSTRYNSQDYLTMAMLCSANVSSGYISSVDINLSRTDSNSYLHTKRTEHHNLHIRRLDWSATSTTEGHIIAETASHPDSTFLRIEADWVFSYTEANHAATITLETTFFNGTDHIKTIMPIMLEVHPS